jgi:hypothetical protein
MEQAAFRHAVISRRTGSARQGNRRKCYFLKKRTKKLLLLCCVDLGVLVPPGAEPNRQKAFGSFFQKRTFLAWAGRLWRARGALG